MPVDHDRRAVQRSHMTYLQRTSLFLRKLGSPNGRSLEGFREKFVFELEALEARCEAHALRETHPRNFHVLE